MLCVIALKQLLRRWTGLEHGKALVEARRAHPAVGVMLLAAACGCSGSKYPMADVAGVVSLDGEPLPGAKLFFSPQGSADNPYPGPKSTGKTDDQGRFELATRDGLRGAVVGRHRVRITTLLESVDPDNPIKVVTIQAERVPFYYKTGGRLDTNVPTEGLEELRFDLVTRAQ